MSTISELFAIWRPCVEENESSETFSYDLDETRLNRRVCAVSTGAITFGLGALHYTSQLNLLSVGAWATFSVFIFPSMWKVFECWHGDKKLEEIAVKSFTECEIVPHPLMQFLVSHPNAIEKLIQKGPDLSRCDAHGQTILGNLPLRDENLPIFKRLVDIGAPFTLKDFERTLESESPGFARYILEKGMVDQLINNINLDKQSQLISFWTKKESRLPLFIQDPIFFELCKDLIPDQWDAVIDSLIREYNVEGRHKLCLLLRAGFMPHLPDLHSIFNKTADFSLIMLANRVLEKTPCETDSTLGRSAAKLEFWGDLPQIDHRLVMKRIVAIATAPYLISAYLLSAPIALCATAALAGLYCYENYRAKKRINEIAIRQFQIPLHSSQVTEYILNHPKLLKPLLSDRSELFILDDAGKTLIDYPEVVAELVKKEENVLFPQEWEGAINQALFLRYIERGDVESLRLILENKKFLPGADQGFQHACWMRICPPPNHTPINVMREMATLLKTYGFDVNANDNSYTPLLKALDQLVHTSDRVDLLKILHIEALITAGADTLAAALYNSMNMRIHITITSLLDEYKKINPDGFEFLRKRKGFFKRIGYTDSTSELGYQDP